MITKNNLKEILELHQKWLDGAPDGQQANLLGANLSGADLSGANLKSANLVEADLRGANFSRANLIGATLIEADLSGANLSGANLSGANLSGANLRKATISIELLNTIMPICCPEEGSFIGWKRCSNGSIVKLEICEDAKRSSASGRKCRCSSAKVLDIQNIDGTKYNSDQVASIWNPYFIYKIGEIVKVNDFDDDRRNECSAGIHFFITRQEAVSYNT